MSWNKEAVLVKDLVKSAGNKLILNGVSFRVPRGAIAGFIGPNGAGKTSTIKVLSGLSKPDDGVVQVLGSDPWGDPKIRIRVGFVFDRLYYPQNNRVGEYLIDMGAIYRRTGDEVRRFMSDFGLASISSTPLGKLSAGQRQKVQLIAALFKDPELVIADEPAANLDPPSRESLYSLIKQYNREMGVSFFVSSHILGELERVANYVVIMEGGRVVREGPFSSIIMESGDGTVTVRVEDLERGVQALKGYHVEVDGQEIRVKASVREVVDTLEEQGVKVISLRRGSLDEVIR